MIFKAMFVVSGQTRNETKLFLSPGYIQIMYICMRACVGMRCMSRCVLFVFSVHLYVLGDFLCVSVCLSRCVHVCVSDWREEKEFKGKEIFKVRLAGWSSGKR